MADPLHLDEQLCFALYAASRAVTSAYRPLLDELGITYPQYLVLLTLWEHEPLTVREIGQRLQLDSGTLSPLLKRLEAAGDVRRERSALDERVVEVHLTERGWALRGRAQCIPEQMREAAGVSHDEVVVLRDRLNELRDTILSGS